MIVDSWHRSTAVNKNSQSTSSCLLSGPSSVHHGVDALQCAMKAWFRQSVVSGDMAKPNPLPPRPCCQKKVLLSHEGRSLTPDKIDGPAFHEGDWKIFFCSTWSRMPGFLLFVCVRKKTTRAYKHVGYNAIFSNLSSTDLSKGALSSN